VARPEGIVDGPLGRVQPEAQLRTAEPMLRAAQLKGPNRRSRSGPANVPAEDQIAVPLQTSDELPSRHPPLALGCAERSWWSSTFVNIGGT
jgi:hypothetical protein